MNLKWICFGQSLEKGMDYYNQGMYADAKGFFQKAFSVNPSDFVLNFWLMRVAVMTHDYTGAKEYLAKCIEMKPALKELLMDPWSKVLDDSIQGKDSEDLETLNQRTNELLVNCHRNRNFAIYDFVGVLALYYLSWSVYEFILDVLQFRLRIQMTIHLISYVYIIKFLIFLVPIGLYYFQKPLCTPNLWIELGRVKRCFSELCKNNSFKVMTLAYCVFLTFPEIYSLFRPEISEEATKELLSRYSVYPVLNFLCILLIAPVLEEILFRGMLFNYIRKYDKTLAYLAVSILFYYYHRESASEEHFIASIVYCWFYDKYGTIVAPMVLHFVDNFLFIVILFIEYLRYGN